MRESNQFNRLYRENQNVLESVKVKMPPKLYESTKEERQSHEATHCLCRAWCEVCVKAKGLDGKHTEQLVDTERIPVIELTTRLQQTLLKTPTGKFRRWLRRFQIKE